MHCYKNLQIFGLNVSSLWRSLERNQNVWLSMNLITLFYFLYLLQRIVLTCKGCTQSANEHRACKLDLSATVRVRKQEGRIYGLAYTEYVCMLRSHKHTATGTLAHSSNGITKCLHVEAVFLSLNNCLHLMCIHTHMRSRTLPFPLLVVPLNEFSDMHQVFMPTTLLSLVFPSSSSTSLLLPSPLPLARPVSYNTRQHR